MIGLNQERIVNKVEAESLANQLGLSYFETSARTGENVEDCIEHLVKECLVRVKESEPRSDDIDISSH